MPEIVLSDTTIIWIQAILGIIVGLAIKDIANNVVQGLLFKYQPHFQQGDHVIIDGGRGVIVSVGYSKTVFRIVNDNGMVTWRYVPNSKIQNLKLEKIVEDIEIDQLESRLVEVEARLEGKIDKLLKHSGLDEDQPSS